MPSKARRACSVFSFFFPPTSNLVERNYFLKKIWVYLPNREELSLRTVVALPKLSSSGDASKICSVTKLEAECDDLLTAAKYCMINLVDSVLPAPLSPLMMTTCGSPSRPISRS